MESTSDESDPWMTEDKCLSSDFVLVTRPLDSIRLADVWLQKERLPDAATTQRITKIRMGLGNRGNSSATATAPPLPNATTTQDECTLLIDQQSFLRDMLRAFTAKPPTSSATAVLSTFSPTDIIGDSTNVPSTTAATTTTQTVKKGHEKKDSSNTNSPTMITDQQWTRIWQQFRADIGREIFCIEGKRYMEADEAYGELIALFKEFESEWLKYQTAQGEANVPSLMQRVSTMVYGVALWPTATALNLALGIIRAPGWLLKGVVGSIGGSSSDTTTPKAIASGPNATHDAVNAPTSDSGSNTSSESNSPKTPPPIQQQQQNPTNAASATAPKVAPNDPLLCEGLARFVVLLSQQSVLAFPYELLMHQFGNGMENVYVGEMRPSSLPDNASAEEREAAEMACSMKVNVARYPSYVKEVPIEVEKGNNKKDELPLQPLPGLSFQQPPAEGYACSAHPVAPPIPVSTASATATANVLAISPSSPRTKKIVSAPFVILKVSKEFRVFALDDSDDCTLFHIVSEISLDVTSASDPVSVSWSLKPAPRRPDRPTESRLQHRGLRPEPGNLPAYATEGNVAPAPMSQPLVERSGSQEGSPNSPIGATRDPAAPVRNCDCLGGSMGYHRRDCALNAGRV